MIKQLRLSLLLPAVLLAAACQQNEASPAPVQAVHVATISATPATGYAARSSYTGRVEARLDSRLGFEIGGLLADVAVDEGDTVSQGAKLARLDSARLEARRAEAAAALEQVNADLALAEATFKRTEEAFDYQGVSQQQLDESRQQLASLEAAQAVATARLASIDVDIDKATLRAPFDGVVVARAADPGAVMAPGESLIALQSSAALEARIGVSPTALPGLATGERYALSVNDRPLEAELKTIVPRRDEATRTVDVIFTVDAGSQGVRPGDLARLDLETFVDTAGYWVPVGALIEGPRGLWQSLVAEERGDGHVLVKHTLEVLHANEQQVYVRGTLAPGDLLVSEGTHRVVAGQTVVVDSTSRLAQADGDD